MEAVQIKVALHILGHAGIQACIVGEIALNYYNVPRVLHDVELCVPEHKVSDALTTLEISGLFHAEAIQEFDIYNEYKRGSPRLRTSSWIAPTCTFVILSDTSHHLAPLEKHIISQESKLSNPTYSSQLLDMISTDDINSLPLPKLSSLFSGLCQRYVQTKDDVAMIAAEQLVDGTDMNEMWCLRHLNGASLEVRALASRLIDEKPCRLDAFSGYSVTCFIADSAASDRIKRLPGYE
ncbi:hypothetical protein EJ05DRAFT_344187 [Pseudovirgaria hyperparasitica]|uniref:Uncharacterized protein n=1 Tax=Pseudovirgaria hyperparasitica TaxID=470096 RepID=A0A6A6WBF3_9PEZI|nr:uncharacterized protein EJ05DRAFT_344187 [Pseudovirgaria hyperparasitica]KAF2759374.1 hypothetical protein EJ05DRAFT_344187 [Pseudovirgaria hyperparasitica]